MIQNIERENIKTQIMEENLKVKENQFSILATKPKPIPTVRNQVRSEKKEEEVKVKTFNKPVLITQKDPESDYRSTDEKIKNEFMEKYKKELKEEEKSSIEEIEEETETEKEKEDEFNLVEVEKRQTDYEEIVENNQKKEKDRFTFNIRPRITYKATTEKIAIRQLDESNIISK